MCSNGMPVQGINVVQVTHTHTHTRMYTHVCTHMCTHTSGMANANQPTPSCALYKQENKKCNEFMILVRRGPHANERLLKDNFREEEKDKARREKPLV